MIEDPVRQRFIQGDNKRYFTSNNTETHYGLHLFANWMRKKHDKILKRFLEKEGCETEITTELMFLDLVKSGGNL